MRNKNETAPRKTGLILSVMLFCGLAGCMAPDDEQPYDFDEAFGAEPTPGLATSGHPRTELPSFSVARPSVDGPTVVAIDRGGRRFALEIYATPAYPEGENFKRGRLWEMAARLLDETGRPIATLTEGDTPPEWEEYEKDDEGEALEGDIAPPEDDNFGPGAPVGQARDFHRAIGPNFVSLLENDLDVDETRAAKSLLENLGKEPEVAAPVVPPPLNAYRQVAEVYAQCILVTCFGHHTATYVARQKWNGSAWITTTSWTNCNHGDCPGATMEKRLTCTGPETTNESLLIDSGTCDTGYDVLSGRGTHNCTDDTFLQMGRVMRNVQFGVHSGDCNNQPYHQYCPATCEEFNQQARWDDGRWNYSKGVLCHNPTNNDNRVFLSANGSLKDASVWANFCISTPEIGDFNGDGAPDMLCRSGGTWTVKTNTGLGFSSTSTWMTNGNFSGCSKVLTGDINGDGFDDALCHESAWPYKKRVALSSGSSFYEQGTYYLEWCGAEILLGDVTGDARADMVCVAGSNAWVQYSNMYYNQMKWADAGQWLYYPWGGCTHYGLVDMNDDRREDLVCHDNNSGKNYVGLSNGSTFQDQGLKSTWCVGCTWFVGDFLADNKGEMACRCGSSNTLYFQSIYGSAPPSLVDSDLATSVCVPVRF